MGKDRRVLDVEELDKDMAIAEVQTEQMAWYDPRKSPFQLSGFGWEENKQTYRRLPKKEETEISDALDLLADCPAGGQIRFQTNTSKLSIKVKLAGIANMNHMSAMGQCGVDCYVGETPKQVFINATRYDHLQTEYEFTFFARQSDEMIHVTLNLPLYQGVEQILVGVDHTATIHPPLQYQSTKKVIFYGTSITQGGCAARPGMAYTNVLSRRFNQEFINLGFSGNGKGEQHMASLLGEIENPACLVIDYEPNTASTEEYMETLPVFIETYRKIHPDVPILLLAKFPYAMEALDTYLHEDRLLRLVFQKELINKLKRQGDQNLYFYEGADLLGDELDECTVDGVHPNDLGFMQIANKLTPILQEIIKQ